MTLTAREDGAAFADVVYADQDWVDAEFAELVAASLSGPPAPPPPAPPRVPPRPGSPPPPSRRTAPGPAVTAVPATRPRHGRQRSPPAPAPDCRGGGGPHDSASAPGHRPGRPGKEKGQRNHLAEPHGLRQRGG